MKAIYGENVLSYDTDKHGHGHFKYGRTSVWKVTIPGHPLSAIDDTNIQQIKTAFLEDRRVTEVKISLRYFENIIQDHMHMENVSARWIPRLLTPLQKQEQVMCAKALMAIIKTIRRTFLID